MPTINRKAEGQIQYEWYREGGKLIRRAVQPAEDAYLSDNRELQKNPGAYRKDAPLGQLIGSIPLNVYHVLLKKHPELNSKDAEIRTAAWMRVLNDREYEHLRVIPRNMARARG